ncbi:MAG: hypothetical protein AB7P03_18445 [Kofleriaceae bacterium]
MRNFTVATALAWCLGCGAASSYREIGAPETTTSCQELNSCGGSGSALVLGLAVAGLLGASALIERLAR